MTQNTVLLRLYNVGNIGSFVLKTFYNAVDAMRCNTTLFLRWDMEYYFCYF